MFSRAGVQGYHAGNSSWGPVCTLKAKFPVSHRSWEPMIWMPLACARVSISSCWGPSSKTAEGESWPLSDVWICLLLLRWCCSHQDAFTSVLVHWGQSSWGLRNEARVHPKKVTIQLGTQKEDRTLPGRLGKEKECGVEVTGWTMTCGGDLRKQKPILLKSPSCLHLNYGSAVYHVQGQTPPF